MKNSILIVVALLFGLSQAIQELQYNTLYELNITDNTQPLPFFLTTFGNETDVSVRIIRRIPFELLESDLGLCVSANGDEACIMVYAIHEVVFTEITPGMPMILYVWVGMHNYNDTVPFAIKWCSSNSTDCTYECPGLCTAKGGCNYNHTCTCDGWLAESAVTNDCSIVSNSVDSTNTIIALVIILLIFVVVPLSIFAVGYCFCGWFGGRTSETVSKMMTAKPSKSQHDESMESVSLEPHEGSATLTGNP